MVPAGEFTVQVEQVDGFEFRVRFDKEAQAALDGALAARRVPRRRRYGAPLAAAGA
jgi:hypothetical protein